MAVSGSKRNCSANPSKPPCRGTVCLGAFPSRRGWSMKRHSRLFHPGVPMTEPLCLTDLHEAPPGLRRVAHGYATSGTWMRLVARGVRVAPEVLGALPRDLIQGLRRAPAA